MSKSEGWELFTLGEVQENPAHVVVDKEALARYLHTLRATTWKRALEFAAQTMRNAINNQRTARHVFVGKPRELWAADVMAVTLEKELTSVNRAGVEVPAAPVRLPVYTPNPVDEAGAGVRGDGGAVASSPS